MIIKKKGLLASVLALTCCASFGVGVALTGLADTQVAPAQTSEATQTTNRAYYVNKEDSEVGYAKDPNSILNGITAHLALDDKLTIRNVINLEEMEAQDKPFIHLQPIVSEVKKAEYTKITLEVIDTYNPNNYFKVQIGPTPQHEDDSTTGYFLACASNGQKLTGYEDGMDKLHINNQYGQWSVFSFSGLISHSSGTGFYYNTAEKQIYAVDYRGVKKMIIDFDDPAFFGSYLWDGFTTNEVYCRVSCGSYKKDRASIMVSQYGNYDLTKAEIHDVVAPALTVNYGEYTKETIPAALKGKKYKIFDASSFDTVDGVVTTDVKVYSDYYSSSNKGEMKITSGYFTPRLTQPHYIVYTAVDAHGNKSEEVVKVNVVSSCDPLAIEFEDVVYTAIEGDGYQIPAYTFSGGLGNIKLTIKATLNGQQLPIEKGVVRPHTSGMMKIVYALEDYIGQEYEVEHEITVTDATKPTFIETPILPKYLLAKNRYTFPALNAYDYVTAEGKAIPTTISVVENGTTTTLTNGEYTIGNASEVKIIYTATIGNAVNEYSVKLPVYNVYDGDALDMGKFFLSENGVSVAKGYSVELKASATESFEFLNYVSALNLSTEFSLTEQFTNAGKFHILLTDIVDSSRQLKFTYVLNTDGIGFYLNDNISSMVAISGTPAKDMRLFAELNMEEKKVYYDISNNKILPIASFLNGEVFDGFAEGFVYVTYQFEDVKGETSMYIHTLNGHYFSEEKRDWIAPSVEFIGEVGGEYTLWNEATLPKVIASDVLSGKADAYITLTSPSGDYVTTLDGKVINNLRYDGSELRIVFAEYGTYLLAVTAYDNAGTLASVYFTYSVVDKVKPTLMLTGEVVATAKVGKTIKLPKATSTDNLSEKLTVVVHVIAPNGQITELKATDAGFKAMKAGVYTVVYSVSDEEGNFDYRYYKITVEE